MSEAAGTTLKPTTRVSLEMRLVVICIIYAVAAALFSWRAFSALLLQYAATQFILLPPILLFGLAIYSIIANPAAPLTFLRGLLKERALGAFLTIALFCVGIAAFTTYKHAIADFLPFFADPPLADLDEILHAGQPWRFLHAVVPESAAPAFYFLYAYVWFAEWLGLIIFAAFLRNNDLRVRYLATFVATLIVPGTIIRALGASAGPIFYDRIFGGNRFDDLFEVLASNPASARMLGTSNYLYSAYQSDTAVFGAGISAMPSIHVAMAVLNALFLARLNRWSGLVGWLIAAGIMFGSVYFGWHYAVDGYVSIAAVLLIWHVAGRAVRASMKIEA